MGSLKTPHLVSQKAVQTTEATIGDKTSITRRSIFIRTEVFDLTYQAIAGQAIPYEENLLRLAKNPVQDRTKRNYLTP